MDLELAVRLSVKDAQRFKAAMREASSEVRQFGRGGGRGVGTGGAGAGGGGRGRVRKEVELGKQVDRVGSRIHHSGLAMERMAYRTGTALMSVVQPALDYERVIVDAVAVTGDAVSNAANEDALRGMSRQFTRFGFSATEVAEGIGYMGMAGMRTNQILGSMEPTLKLAKAASLDLARTTDLGTDIMTAFSLKSGSVAEAQKSMTRVADVMTHTFTSSNTTLSLASQSLFKIGNLAVQAGLSLETTAGAVGMLASAGIKGSESGTAIRNMLLRLTNPTKQVRDTFKRLRLDIDDVTDAIARDDLPKALKLLDDAMGKKNLNEAGRLKVFGTVFGARAASSGAFLTSMAKTGELGKKISDTRAESRKGTLTETIAEKKMKSDAAKVQQMRAELQQMGIDLGTKVLPGLMPIARVLVDMAQDLAKYMEKHPDAVRNIAKMLAGMTAFGSVLGPIATSLGGATRGIGLLISMRNATQQTVGGLTGALGGGVGGGGGLVGAAGSSTGKVALLSKALGSAGLVAAAGAAGLAIGTAADQLFGISDKLSGVGSGRDDDVSGSNWLSRLFGKETADYKGSGGKLAFARGSARYTEDEGAVVKDSREKTAAMKAEHARLLQEQKDAGISDFGTKRGVERGNRMRELTAAIKAEEGIVGAIERKAFARTQEENVNIEKYRPVFEDSSKKLFEQRMHVESLFNRARDAKRGQKVQLSDEEEDELGKLRESTGLKRKDALMMMAVRAKSKYESERDLTANVAGSLGIGLTREQAVAGDGAGWREKMGIGVEVTLKNDGSASVTTKANGKERTVNADAGQMISLLQ